MSSIIGQTRPDQLIVSFCIPVYNNAEAAERLVKGILCSDSTRFEVVVSDDASTDDCEERLSRINDSRFRYYRNEKNLGAHKNWEHALELGQGEYLYLVMGRDIIHGEHIDKLIEILEYAHENNITLLQDGYSNDENIRVYDGIDAMIFFLVIIHPTGTIFSKRVFDSIPDRTGYFEISDMYPENYIRRDMLLNGKGASIMSGAFNRVGTFYDSDTIKKGSTVEYGKNLYDMYYAPRRRAVQTFEIMDMLPDTFSEADSNKYFRENFNAFLLSVSQEWRNWCSKDYPFCRYYGHEPRHVSTLEMLKNIITAHNATVRHLKEKGKYTSQKRRIMNHITMRTLIRFILEPVGIWDMLGYIKHLIKG